MTLALSSRSLAVVEPERLSLPRVRVVIADGQPLMRAGLRVLLPEQERIDVVGEAATGEEAVALARSVRPDIVALDAALPGLGCVEATAQISADPGAAVLVLAATEADDRIFAALRAGAIGLVLKDAEQAELVRAVRALVHGNALLSPSLTRRLIAEFAARPEPDFPDVDLLDELTAREREVVGLVGLGLVNDEIAERLVVTTATVKTHVGRAMMKLDARTRAQLVGFAYESGLVMPRAAAVAQLR